MVDGPTKRTVAWSTVGLAAAQGSRIVIALLLARILGPEQFTPVAAGAVYMTFVALSVDLGLVAAIIQRQTLTDAHLRVAALASWAVGGIFTAGTLAVCLAGLAGAWGSPSMLLFSMLAFAPLIRSIGLVRQSRLYREQRQHLIGKAETAVALFALVCCLASVYFGLGVYSYGVALLAAEVALAAIWLLQPGPFPLPGWDRSAFRELWSFSSKSFGADALSVMTRNSDSIAVGWLAGASQLSLYSVGVRFLVTPIQFVGEAIVRVTLPEFSERNRNGVPLGPTLVARTAVLSRAAWPMLIAAFFIAPWAVTFVLGEAWRPAIVVTQALCVAAAIQISLAFLRPAIVSVGAVRPYLAFSIGVFVLSAITYVAGAWAGGAFGAAVGYLIVWCASAPALVILASKLLAVQWARLASALAAGVPGGLVVAAVAYLGGLWVDQPAQRVGLQAVAAGVVLAAVLGVSLRQLIWKRLGLARSR